jgi:signal transduction histidine kinase
VFDLLENLLTWARLQMGRMEYEPEEVDLSELVAKNVELLQANAEAKGIILRSEIQPKVKVYADVNMLNTVVRNLTSNALKFTSSGGEVLLQVRPVEADNNELMVVVKDNGVGMGAESLANLFKIGHNQSTMGTAREKGTGLGLIMCKEMVELNGGQIGVESEIGRGTTVYFTVRVEHIGLPS